MESLGNLENSNHYTNTCNTWSKILLFFFCVSSVLTYNTFERRPGIPFFHNRDSPRDGLRKDSVLG